MDLQLALEQRAKVEEFQRKHRIGLLTLLFTDLVGSTKLKQELGDRESVALIQQHHALVREILNRFPEGEEIGTAGDSFFIVFTKPSDATQFSLLLQSRLRSLARQTSRPLLDRIGVHIGEVVIEERPDLPKPKDMYGLQVDICARIMSLAEGDQIVMTRSAFDNARQVLKGEAIEGVGALSWLNHGPYVLKGVEEPMEICEVGELGAAILKPPPDSEKVHRYVSADDESVLGWRPAIGQGVPGTSWVLEEKLGEGGFGEVWLGRHTTIKERRVFKFCFRADRVRSLKREVTLFRLLKERVASHPHLVAVHDVYFDQPPFYIELDYVEGRDLKTWSETQGGLARIPLATRLEIVAQIAEALQAAHEAGVIHRDVKPSNILIETNSASAQEVHAKLTDFGIGQVVSQELLADLTHFGFTQTMMAQGASAKTGTQIYMAPELLQGKAASAQSDLYSLGVILYQLLVWDFARPLPADWEKDITDALLRSDLMRCIASEPQERFDSAKELAKNLRSLERRRKELAKKEKSAFRENPAFRRGVAHGQIVASLGVGFVLVLVFLSELETAWCIRGLKSVNPRVRHDSVHGLERNGRAWNRDWAFHALVEALKDVDSNVRAAAAGACLKLRPHSRESVPAVIALLVNKEQDWHQSSQDTHRREAPDLRLPAARALASLGPYAADNLSAIVGLLEDPTFEFAHMVLELFDTMKSAAKPAVPPLVELLKDPSPWIRRRAAEALGRIGPEAKEAMPVLVGLLEEPHFPVRLSVALAVVRIQPRKEAVSVLSLALDRRELTRQLSAELKNFGQMDRRYWNEIMPVNDEDDYGCLAAEELGNCGLEAGPAIPALLDALKPDPAHRKLVSMVESWGVPGSDLDLATARGLRLRWCAFQALRKLGPEARDAVPALALALEDKDWKLRWHAAMILGSIGADAQESAAPLAVVTNDTNPFVREAATDALKRINGQPWAPPPSGLKEMNPIE